MNRTSRSSRLVRTAARSPGPLDRRSRRVAHVHPELAGDDRREGRLAEAGRAVEEDVVRGLSPGAGGGEQDREVRLDLALPDVLVQVARPQRALDDDIRVVEVRRQDPRDVVRHRAEVYQHSTHIRTDVLHRPTTTIDTVPILSIAALAVAGGTALVIWLMARRFARRYIELNGRVPPPSWMFKAAADPALEFPRKRALSIAADPRHRGRGLRPELVAARGDSVPSEDSQRGLDPLLQRGADAGHLEPVAGGLASLRHRVAERLQRADHVVLRDRLARRWRSPRHPPPRPSP